MRERNAVIRACRRGLWFAGVVLAACGGGGAADDTGDDGDDPDAAFDPTTPHRYELGPFTLAPGEEDNSLCVSVELHNAEPVFIHAVRLETGGGFHHSNWFHVPHDTFRGPDGIWPCADRGFSEPVASAFGGVLFAQSTQADDELQEFPAGAAIPIAPGAKVVAALHLLNASDVELVSPLALTITPLPRAEVTVQLRPIAIEDKGLALPPQRRSTVSSTCDLGPKHQQFFGTDPDFHLYYVLPHYHRLGIGMRIDAIDADGTEHLAFDNDAQIGTSLGGPIDPPFAMNGATQLRMTCRYDNVTEATVGNGIGDQEMCVMLGFTDSPNQWGGTYSGAPGDGVDTGEAVAFDHGCSVFTLAKEDL